MSQTPHRRTPFYCAISMHRRHVLKSLNPLFTFYAPFPVYLEYFDAIQKSLEPRREWAMHVGCPTPHPDPPAWTMHLFLICIITITCVYRIYIPMQCFYRRNFGVDRAGGPAMRCRALGTSDWLYHPLVNEPLNFIGICCIKSKHTCITELP